MQAISPGHHSCGMRELWAGSGLSALNQPQGLRGAAWQQPATSVQVGRAVCAPVRNAQASDACLCSCTGGMIGLLEYEQQSTEYWYKPVRNIQS